MDIMITKSNTEKRGSKIMATSDDFKNDVKELLSIVETINKAWQDDQSLTHINTLRDKYIVNLFNLGFAMEKYGEYLNKVPQAYTMLDESFASRNIQV
jgi:hypothetical protein